MLALCLLTGPATAQASKNVAPTPQGTGAGSLFHLCRAYGGALNRVLPEEMAALGYARKLADLESFFGGGRVSPLHPGTRAREMRSLLADLLALKQKHIGKVFSTVGEMNSRTAYRVGLNIDKKATTDLEDYALFGLNLFRVGTAEIFLGKVPEGERVRLAEALLRQIGAFGAKAVVEIMPRVAPRRPADVTMSHEFLPSLRPSFFRLNFNSRRVRSVIRAGTLRWAQALDHLPMVHAFKIGNEPFWSIHAYPALGYDQATVGCSPETIRSGLRRRYRDIHEWRSALSRAPLQKVGRTTLDPSIFPWSAIDEVSVPPEEVEGLTFVDFLRGRYPDLEGLNRAWFGQERSRYHESWTSVLPPVPVAADRAAGGQKSDIPDVPEELLRKDARRSVKPRPRDVRAWTDWCDFWPRHINDYITSVARHLERNGVRHPVTTNCITAHFIGNHRESALSGALNPWDTAAGLDVLAVDFYAIQYCQAFLRAMAGAARGRPVEIYEAGGAGGLRHTGIGASPEKTAFMALYAFAYGADALLFWRRDARLEPVLLAEIAAARQALDHPRLQHDSAPLTDGIALVYSRDSLNLATAESGFPSTYLDPFKGAALAATRLQLLYDLYTDRQLESGGIPDRVKALLMPEARSVSGPLFERIRRFVKRGGLLVTTTGFGDMRGAAERRDIADRGWLENNPGVLTIDGRHLPDWYRRATVGDKLLGAISPDVAPWLERVDRAVQAVAPRTVTYRDENGRLASRFAGARRSGSDLFVFLDPWAPATTVEVLGAYEGAFDRYRRREVAVEVREGKTRVRLPGGPALVHLVSRSARASDVGTGVDGDGEGGMP